MRSTPTGMAGDVIVLCRRENQEQSTVTWCLPSRSPASSPSNRESFSWHSTPLRRTYFVVAKVSLLNYQHCQHLNKMTSWPLFNVCWMHAGCQVWCHSFYLKDFVDIISLIYKLHPVLRSSACSQYYAACGNWTTLHLSCLHIVISTAMKFIGTFVRIFSEMHERMLRKQIFVLGESNCISVYEMWPRNDSHEGPGHRVTVVCITVCKGFC